MTTPVIGLLWLPACAYITYCTSTVPKPFAARTFNALVITGYRANRLFFCYGRHSAYGLAAYLTVESCIPLWKGMADAFSEAHLSSELMASLAMP